MENGGGFNNNGSSSRKLQNSTLGVSKQYERAGKTKDLCAGKSFIKVMGRQLSKQLQIPKEFMANFKGNVPHRFIIESTRTKKCWRIEVEADENGMVCFGEGWNDFVKAHSLEAGDILVFEYEEQSILQVKIYGKNGCEKTTFKAMESKNSLGLHQVEKRIELEGDEGSQSDEYEENTSSKHRQKMRRRSSPGRGEDSSLKKELTYTRVTEVSISENCVGFSTTLHKRKQYQLKRLAIPKAISDAKNLSRIKEVILQNKEGGRWPVEITNRRESHAISFSKGWKEFVDDNKIVGGEKLTFKFISDNVIQVQVIRSSKVEHHSGDEASGLLNADCDDDEQRVTCKNDDKAIDTRIIRKRSSPERKRSSFSFTWGESTTGTYLHIPRAVAEDQNLKTKDKVVLRDPEGKCWPLDVRIWYDGSRAALTKGWREFWKGHNITPGDALHFEFASECLIQVTIDRAKPPTIEGLPKNPQALDNRETVMKPLVGAIVTQQQPSV